MDLYTYVEVLFLFYLHRYQFWINSFIRTSTAHLSREPPKQVPEDGKQAPQSGLANFPIIANANTTILKATAMEHDLKIQVLNLKNEVIDNLLITGK
jgi:hypothetical protein